MTDAIDPVPTVSEPTRPRSKRRRWLKIVVYLLLFFLVFLGTVIYLAYTKLFTGANVKQQLEGRISAMIGLTVQVKSLDLNFPAITLRDIAIGDIASAPLPWARLDMISITPDLLRLLTGTIHFESVTLSSGTLSLARDASGAIILPAPLQSSGTPPAPGAPAAEPPSFPFSSLEISNLRVILEDQGLGKTVRLTIPTAGISRSLLSATLPTLLQIHAERLGRLDLSGKIRWPDGFDGTLDVTQVDLPALKEFLPPSVELPGAIASPTLHLAFSAHRSGRLEISEWTFAVQPGLKATGKISLPKLSPPEGSITFSVPPVPVKTLYALAGTHLPASARGLDFPEGKISLGGDITLANGTIGTPTIWIRPEGITMSSPQLPDPLRNLSARLSITGSTVSWQDAGCSLAGAAFGSKAGSIDWKRDFAGSADLTIEATAEKLLASLKAFLPADAMSYRPVGHLSGQGKVTIAGSNSVFNGNLNLREVSVVPPQTGVPIKVSQGRAVFRDFGLNSGLVTIEELAGETMGAHAKVTGTIASPAAPVFHLKADGTADLAVLHQKLPIENELFKKKSEVSGAVSLSAELSGTAVKPDLKGAIRLSNARFAIPEQKLIVENIQSDVALSLDQVKVNSLSALIGGGQLTVLGTVKNFQHPTLDLKGDLKKADLREITTFLAKNFAAFPPELEVIGNADLNLKISGKAAQPKVEGEALLGGIRFFHPAVMRPLEHISGPVRFTNTTLSAQGVKVSWGSSTAIINGSVKDLAAFDLDFRYTVQPLDVTDIGRFFLGTTGYVFTGQGSGHGRLFGPLASFTLEGNAKIPQGQFEAPISQNNRSTFKFPFVNLDAETHFHQGVLTVKKASTQLFQGTVTTNGKVFLTETPVRFDFDTKGVQLLTEEFLRVNSTQKQALKGGIDFSLKTSGNTTGLQSLNGNSFLLMKKGHYQSPPMVSQIFSLLQANQLTSGTIENLAGNFIFQNGRMNSNDFLVNNPLGHIKYRGWVGLDTTLQGTVDLMLTAEACRQSTVLRQLVGNQKNVTMSVGVKGSLLSPSIDLGLEKLLRDAAKKHGKQILQEALTGKLTGTASGTPTPKQLLKGVQDDLGKLIGGAFRGRQPTSPPPASTSAPAPAQTPTAPTSPPAVSPSPPPATASPTTPKQEIKKELKKIEKNLKNLFKF